MKLTLSLGQMDVELGNPARNLETAQAFVEEAERRGSHLLILPELWSTGYDLEHGATHATPTDAGMFAQIGRLARKHHLHILGSCLAQQADGIANTLVWHGRDGRILGEYSKLHLFRLMDEDQYLVAGQQPVLVKSEWGLAGLTICYDLRFPELFRRYAVAGAQMAFVPAEWPHPRLAHWQTLLRARAIENQFFVIACNRVGTSKNSSFFGHSCIINPWGETVIEAGEQEILLTAEIDLAEVAAARQRIPILSDRRPEVY
jgi:omega-amidase